jgi:methylphosphotriester-DNA--protein-cysteine methyltransferase
MPHPQFDDDTTRWTAVQSKDPEADGAFVYAVKTTKIYCRPVCKARLARRANVSFYPSPTDAARAGYRACKRCEPSASGSMPEAKGVKKVRTWALQELRRNRQKTRADEGHQDGISPEPSKLAEMATTAGVSKWHFHRICKEISGQTPVGYVKQQGVMDDGPQPTLPLSTDGEIKLSSRRNSDSRAGEWHGLQCDAAFFQASTHVPLYSLPQSLGTDQLNELFCVLSDDWDFPVGCNPTMPWLPSGDDLPDFTWALDNDSWTSLFRNGISPDDTESNTHHLISSGDHASNWIFR